MKMLKIKVLKVPNEALTGLSTTYVNKFIMKNTKSIAKTTKEYKTLCKRLETSKVWSILL